MAIFQLANWRGPVPNKNVGAMVRPFKGLVLHIQQGNENERIVVPQPGVAGLGAFRQSEDRRAWTWVDTNDKAWAQVAGNSSLDQP